jgi:hypothetical protein
MLYECVALQLLVEQTGGNERVHLAGQQPLGACLQSAGGTPLSCLHTQPNIDGENLYHPVLLSWDYDCIRCPVYFRT